LPTAVWQNGGFSAFLEANCLNKVQEFLVALVLKNRHFAKLPKR
jgi:hypothetical protein